MTAVSVVIPCRNAAAELPGQLRALAAQDCVEPWQVVISDNGSTDDTRLVAQQFADRVSIRIVDSSTQPGRAFACNIGAAAADGDKILFLDADDEVAAGYVAALARGLDSHSAVVARLDPTVLNQEWVQASRPAGLRTGLLDTLRFLPFGLGCSLGVRRAAFDAVGGFAVDVTYAEDVDLCWRLQQAGMDLHFVPDAVLYRRYRTSIRELYRQSRGYGSGQVALYRKHRAAGMPRRAVGSALRDWAGLGRGALRIRNRAQLGKWAHGAGYRVGRLRGSVQYRTLYL